MTRSRSQRTRTINNIRIGSKKEIQELQVQITENKAEANKTINGLLNKIDRVSKLATLMEIIQMLEDVGYLTKEVNKAVHSLETKTFEKL